jgi:type IV pilus assembly protein PilW
MKRILYLPLRGLISQTQSGFTLIELLVATVIGLLGTIVIFTVYQNAEGFKRTTIAAGDAQTSGAIALYTLEQYIRTSGSGITTTNEVQLTPGSASAVQPNLLLGCSLVPPPNVGTGSAVTSVGATATPIAPVRIIDGSLLPAGIAGTSDVLVIMSGNADIATNPTRAAGNVLAGASSLSGLSNLLGWRAASGAVPPFPARRADIALFADAGTGGTFSASPCALRRIVSTQAVPGVGNTMTLASALPPGAAYPASSIAIHDVGPTPYFISIGVNAAQELVETSFLPGLTGEGAGANRVTTRVIAEGIVNIQAQYGVDNDLNDTIDAWVEPTNNAIGNWSNVSAVLSPNNTTTASTVPAINKIKAIRLGILARSQQYEAPNRTTGLCSAVTDVPATWQVLPASAAQGSAPNGSIAYPAGPNIRPTLLLTGASPNGDFLCFRYRRFETIIPIINMVRSPL